MNLRITENCLVAPKTYRMVLQGSGLTHRAGQFINIAVPGYYLRRPISVCDSSDSSLTIYYKTVGEGTAALSGMPVGETLDVLTGLGNSFSSSACRQEALLIGGGLGAAPMYALAKQLLAEGKRPTVVLGFNTASDIVLEDDLRLLGVKVLVATMNGTAGVKGTVLDAIAAGSVTADCFYTCGPLVMMKAVCEALDIPGEVSLEERMGCGAGYCYGCSRMMKSGAKRICKDGPVFPKDEVIW